MAETIKIATFAGGCFWCMQGPYDKTEGVIKTVVGYAGGTQENPTYEQVASGQTNHIESVQIHYDEERISYEKLLDIFWKNIDPTVENKQFCDTGPQYRSAIFYHNATEQQQAEQSKEAVIADKTNQVNEVFTEIIPFTTFYDAETYHQDYYKKNPIRYKFYRTLCGRDKRLNMLWGPE